MRIYTLNDSANPTINYGTDAAQRIMARNGAKHAVCIEGPDSIGCYLVTLDNGDQLDISRGEQVASGVGDCLPGFMLLNRSAIKAWLSIALRDNARRNVAADMAATAKQAGFDADAAFNAACADLDAWKPLAIA